MVPSFWLSSHAWTAPAPAHTTLRDTAGWACLPLSSLSCEVEVKQSSQQPWWETASSTGSIWWESGIEWVPESMWLQPLISSTFTEALGRWRMEEEARPRGARRRSGEGLGWL